MHESSVHALGQGGVGRTRGRDEAADSAHALRLAVLAGDHEDDVAEAVGRERPGGAVSDRSAVARYAACAGQGVKARTAASVRDSASSFA